MARPRKTKQTSLDFAFFTHLLDFYKQHKGRIWQSYRELTRKYLAFNDPANATAYLRPPQFEALEIYIFLKEFLGNQAVHELYRDWSEQTGRFEGRTKAAGKAGQFGLFSEQTKEEFAAVFAQMQDFARAYPNYIFALTMGTGKTILMATCIFYEFILANKFPKDERYCHNALVFAPDTTVLESLREIQTFDKAQVVPAEYVAWLDANIRFHFLEESGVTLNLLDRSRFNLIISNTQKIILKRQRAEKTPMDKLMQSGKPTYAPSSVYAEFGDLYGGDGAIESEDDLATNQRFEKLRRLGQLGIYVDEAHHAFGTQLARDMGLEPSKTSLRVTIDALAASLKATGTRVVACYNYTGTPYVQNQILPEVVYAFGLKDAIDQRFLKRVRIHDYSNPKSHEFVGLAINDFLTHHNLDDRHEGMRPKMAFFAATIEELQHELRPAVEAALARHDIPAHRVLVNVGDDKLTSNDDIREFRRLDTPESEKQFILLVNKGREGWNCRSLFAVALYRKPKSKIFVLQATMRCLRAIGPGQPTGHVYLSTENRAILDGELQQNFRVTLSAIEQGGSDHQVVRTHVKEPVEKVRLKRVRRLYQTRERPVPATFSLELSSATTEGYRLIHTEREGLAEYHRAVRSEDLSHLRERRTFSAMTLVAELARYLNKPCLEVEALLERSNEGMATLLTRVNEFNELLYDWVIPRLFTVLYAVDQFERTEDYEVELVKVPPTGYYELSASPHLVVTEGDAGLEATKSFHLDTYCFDSNPERELFWKLLRDGRVQRLYFTGMLTHGQSEFFVQYIDPESHTIRSYYPDFLLQGIDGTYTIVEVKGDNQIDAPVVLAKQAYAEQLAGASGMHYRIIKGSDANAGRIDLVLGSPEDAARQYGLSI